MGIKSCFTACGGSVALGGLFAGVGAGLAAASGAAGAKILDELGCENYNYKEAAEMGAVGGAILNGIVGASVGCMAGALAGSSLFNSKQRDRESGCSVSINCGVPYGYIGSMTLSGLIGYGLRAETVMNLGTTAAAFALGSLVTAIPVAAATICICIPLAVSAWACMNNRENDKVEAARPSLV